MNKIHAIPGFLFILFLAAGCSSPTSVTSTPTANLTSAPPTTTKLTSAPPTTATQTAAPTPTATLSADAQLVGKLDVALAALAQQGSLSGAILVARDGNVIFNQGYGMANMEQKIPNTPEIKFHIGSLTKQFTAMAILLLQKQGKLDVKASVCKYIEDCPEAWQPVTIQQLLIHTSGIHEFNKTPGMQEFVLHPATPLQIISQFRDLPLDFTPGEQFSFSNSGYMLLGYIVEKVSGQPYASFLQQEIFDPLQMKNTGYDDEGQTGSDHALGYMNGTTPPPFVDRSIQYAASGLYSTVGDLLLWDQALYTEKLLPALMQDEMFKPFVAIPASTLSCGYGWYVGKQFDQPWFYTASGAVGFVGEINRFPATKVTIIILTNRQDTDLKSLNALISPIVFGKDWVSPTK